MNYSMCDNRVNYFLICDNINVHTDKDRYNYYASPKQLSSIQKFKLAVIFQSRKKLSHEETAVIAAEFNVSTRTIITWFRLQRRYEIIRGEKHQSKKLIYMYMHIYIYMLFAPFIVDCIL